MQDSTRSIIPLKLVAAGGTDIGRNRKHNEDSVLLRTDLNLFILADGAGGHNAGNVASALATTSIANFLEETADREGTRPEFDAFGLATDARRLVLSIQRANRDIIEIANSSNKRRGMGTTVVCGLISLESASLHLAHVGDSRCYRLRGGEFELLTFDHSLIHDVLELKPDMQDDALARLPRHVVTRALGMEEPVRVSVRTHHVVAGDRYLMCSDGLTDALEPEQICEVLRLPKGPDELVGILIDLANNSGGQDNIAAIVISCEMGHASVVSARMSALPRARRPPSVPPPETDLSPDSSPEIVLLSTDLEPELEFDVPFHVVPSESASEGMIDALEDLFASPRSTAATRKKSTKCAACGTALDPDVSKCPTCGTER